MFIFIPCYKKMCEVLIVRRNILSFFLAMTLLMILLAGCDTMTDPDPVDDTVPSSDYELVWSDEFNQTSTTPDQANWNYDIGYGADGWGNDEWQYYTDSVENVKVEDGNLVLTATWDSGNYLAPGKRDGSVTSGRINTGGKFSMKYGKVEARIKPPEGSGIWPAFWMLGSNFGEIGWPYCGEIDIMEMSPLYYDEKTTICTAHWFDDDAGEHASYGSSKAFDESLANDYHIFSLEWDANRIVGRIDGMTYMIRTIDPATMDEFRNDFFIILNIAVGGGFGGAPDDTTEWPQKMYIDWIHCYQTNPDTDDAETFGIFSDNTPVDDGITPGLDAEIYVWENTLSTGSIDPYEGDNVMAFITTGVGWFGAGIEANEPVDISHFAGGNLKCMIKMPSDVHFWIGMNDNGGSEHYVEFPAGETAFGLTRNGEWGQATIPIQDIAQGLDLGAINYTFMIKEEDGMQCSFAIDDIYLDGGGTAISSVSFSANSYSVEDDGATIEVIDEAAAGTTVTVFVDNGSDNIDLDVSLDENGSGSSTLLFEDLTVSAGTVLTARYTDANGIERTDTANITAIIPDVERFGVFTDTTPVTSSLTIDTDSYIYVWEYTLTSTEIAPWEGDNVIAWQTTGSGWFGGGVMTADSYDLSAFSSGTVKFMIKMPSDVTFKIGVQDQSGHEDYVTFTAGQTLYGLTRDGEWGQASIPVGELIHNVDISDMSYVFTILEESGAQCEFAIDDIYWEEGEETYFSNVAFDADSYTEDAASATVSVVDEAITGSTVQVSVSNGTDSIQLDVALDSEGEGSSTLDFSADTIEISSGMTLTVSYTDHNGDILTDTANVTSSGPSVDTFGIYTETSPVTDGITVGSDAQIYVWENTLSAGTIEPWEGEYSMSWQSTGAGWFGGGIKMNQALDLSAYDGGTIEIMIKIPANVTFKIGMTDTAGHEKYVSFPAGQEVFGLTRDGEWGRASIPIGEYTSTIDISALDYVFTILEENGAQCDFAIDDIYWVEATN